MNLYLHLNYDPGLFALNNMGRGHWFYLDYKDNHIYFEGLYKTHTFQVDMKGNDVSICIEPPQAAAKLQLPRLQQWRKTKILGYIRTALLRRLCNEDTCSQGV